MLNCALWLQLFGSVPVALTWLVVLNRVRYVVVLFAGFALGASFALPVFVLVLLFARMLNRESRFDRSPVLGPCFVLFPPDLANVVADVLGPLTFSALDMAC